MKLVDLHCDTPYRIYRERLSFEDPALQVSAKRLFAFDQVTQVLAVWSDKNLSDQEAYAAFWEIRRSLLEALDRSHLPPDFFFFFAVEDARLLCGDIDRLDILHGAGVRFLTLMWHGSTLIGGACDTDDPLLPFGRQTVRRCFEIGVIPDVSHASRRCIEEVAEIAASFSAPFIATHSNSYAVVPHRRNLTDFHFNLIKNSGGIVGISMAPRHLSAGERCGIADVVAHIEHFFSLGGEDCLCLGCDYDGIDGAPVGLESVDRLPRLASELARLGYSDRQIEKIFSANAQAFLDRFVHK